MIEWLEDWDEAQRQARARRMPMLIDVSRDNCSGCERLMNETFADATVAAEVTNRFVPVHLDLQRDRGTLREWDIVWTPTVLFADRSGKIRYSNMNFVPAGVMLDLLDIGEARVAMRWQDFETAIRRLHDVEDRHPDGSLTAEAIYWRGIATYFQAGQDGAVAKAIWAEIRDRFPGSVWAQRQP